MEVFQALEGLGGQEGPWEEEDRHGPEEDR